MNSPPLLIEPVFLPDAEALLAHLLAAVEWDERMKARKTASFGVSYDYSQIAYKAQPMPSKLQEVANLVGQRVGFTPNNCLLNYYADGKSSMGFHSDSAEELTPGTGVAIVSLGSERAIVFRNKAEKSLELSYPLPAGSLLYMTKRVQDDWLHAIPKTENAGVRVSLTFRSIVK